MRCTCISPPSRDAKNPQPARFSIPFPRSADARFCRPPYRDDEIKLEPRGPYVVAAIYAAAIQVVAAIKDIVLRQ
jgi:hypothetical protein